MCRLPSLDKEKPAFKAGFLEDVNPSIYLLGKVFARSFHA
jgi:hypothetical protein